MRTVADNTRLHTPSHKPNDLLSTNGHMDEIEKKNKKMKTLVTLAFLS